MIEIFCEKLILVTQECMSVFKTLPVTLLVWVLELFRSLSSNVIVKLVLISRVISTDTPTKEVLVI